MRKAILALSLALWAPAAFGQLLTVGVGGAAAAFSGAAYSGPGDVVTGALAWFGLRGYTAAFSNNTHPAISVRLNSGNNCDVLIKTNGQMGNTANCDVGGDNGQNWTALFITDATCTGTISGTTLSVSSCSSGTLHVQDQITGAGITNPAFITVIGTCASPPGTCTLNASQTVSVGETITASVNIQVHKFYDQSGSGLNLLSTGTSGASLYQNCIGTLPCTYFFGAANAYAALTVSSTAAIPVTFSAVAERTGNTSALSSVISDFNNTTGQPLMGFASSANNAVDYSGLLTFTAAANDNVVHALQGLTGTGTAGVLNVDGTETTGNSGTGANFTKITVGGDPFAGDQLTGFIFEAGEWASGLTGTQRTNLCHNEHVFWNTPTSC